MTTETYNFKYSSKNGWEGDFDKLDQLEESLTGSMSSDKPSRFSIVLAVTIILIIIIGILYSFSIIPHPQRTANFDATSYYAYYIS